jgi:hypothetical protein
MRTYSWMVPLEERTLTVLGYMRTIITTFFGIVKELLPVALIRKLFRP